MLLTLTDHLTCPRCGPSAGLILLMERAEDRRVVTGALGCPVCRTQYRIDGRVADLRSGTSPESTTDVAMKVRAGEQDPAELAVRVAALTDPGAERGFVLVDGLLAGAVAEPLGGYLPDQELVVRIDPSDKKRVGGQDVSAMLADAALPLGDRSMRAAAWVGGAPSEADLAELFRVVRPTGRLVIDVGAEGAALDGLAEAVVARGARVKARDATGLVAVVF